MNRDLMQQNSVDMSLMDGAGQSSMMELTTPMQKAMEARELANIQGKIFMAKRYPRNYEDVLKKIGRDCSRVALASQAVYEYSRAGTKITGPSIRLAETLALSFGNIESVTEVLSQTEEASLVRTYSWDYESNRQASRTFMVRHERDTKKGRVKLTDNRDIMELINNIAARNRRACILELIPGDYVEYALNTCEETLRNKVKITPDTLTSLLNAFSAYGVTRAMIEARLQRSLEAISTGQYLEMQRIWASLKDGMGKPEDFFDTTITDDKDKMVDQSLTSGRKTQHKDAKTADASPKTENKPQVHDEEPVADELAPSAPSEDSAPIEDDESMLEKVFDGEEESFDF